MHSGLAWKLSNSLLTISLCSFTVTWLYATQPTQTPSVQRNVHHVAEEDEQLVITWMTCTLWPRAHSTWHDKSEKKTAGMARIKVVCQWGFKVYNFEITKWKYFLVCLFILFYILFLNDLYCLIREILEHVIKFSFRKQPLVSFCNLCISLICDVDILRFQSSLPDGSVCDVRCLRDGNSDNVL